MQEEILSYNRKIMAAQLFESVIFDKRYFIDEDKIKMELLHVLEVDFLEKINPSRIVTVTADRPSFIDWLFRRKRSFSLKIDCADLLENPPKLPGNQRTYEVAVVK